MQICTGDMWTVFEKADLFIFTGNGTITHTRGQPELVMGRGIALQVRNRFNGIANKIAQRLLDDPYTETIRGAKVYYLLVSPGWPKAKVGVFQVKYHYNEAANLDMIRKSANLLGEFMDRNPAAVVHMNYPGIGWGHLKEETVAPVIEELLGDVPNLNIWKKE